MVKKLKTLILGIAAFHNISTEFILSLKKPIVMIATIILTIVTYFIIDLLIERKFFEQAIDILINIDLALFALQIATFTLLLAPFKNLEKQVEKRKSVYIRVIEKDRSLYDSAIYEKLNDYLYFYNRQFRYNIFKMIVLAIHFAITILFCCITIISRQAQITFLFSNLVCQLIYFIDFLLLLVNLFSTSKNGLEINITEERAYLNNKYKVYNTKKSDLERRKIAYEIERIAREEENDG